MGVTGGQCRSQRSCHTHTRCKLMTSSWLGSWKTHAERISGDSRGHQRHTVFYQAALHDIFEVKFLKVLETSGYVSRASIRHQFDSDQLWLRSWLIDSKNRTSSRVTSNFCFVGMHRTASKESKSIDSKKPFHRCGWGAQFRHFS